MAIELTPKQTEQQDAVDNEIYNLIVSLAPDRTWSKLEWDIEIISNIREVLLEYYIEKGIYRNEMEFYPYVEGEKNE